MDAELTRLAPICSAAQIARTIGPMFGLPITRSAVIGRARRKDIALLAMAKRQAENAPHARRRERSGATMNPEWKRGLNEAHQHFEALRARWPLAFPAKNPDVRPLASSVAPIVAATMGWPEPYASGVLRGWKARYAYCRACLVYPTRIALDGSLTEETVDDEARAMAKRRTERLARKGRSAQDARDAAGETD
jgi:hypothetical protein